MGSILKKGMGSLAKWWLKGYWPFLAIDLEMESQD
jgi:hypothetical protein